MSIWIAPIVFSYVIFAFIAEHINPFKKFREDVPLRLMRSGRRAGIVALFSSYLALFMWQFLPPLLTTSPPSQLAKEQSLVQTNSSVATSAPNTETQSQAAAPVASKPSTQQLTTQTTTPTTPIQATPTIQATQETQTAPTTESLREPVKNNSLSEQTKWIKAQAPRNHTIHIYNSTDKSTVEAFLEQSQLPEPNSIYAYDRNGRTWFALVHGSFNSTSSAETALAQMPQQAKVHNPYVRRFENIQPTVE